MRYVSNTGAAKILGVSSGSISNWIKTGLLKSYGKDGLLESDVLDIKDQIMLGKIDRLGKRANKNSNTDFVIPVELVSNLTDRKIFIAIVEFIKTTNITIEKVIILVILNILRKKQHIDIENNQVNCRNNFLKNEIDIVDLSTLTTDEMKILDLNIPEHSDPAGVIYQSLRKINNKSGNGAYYTPETVINEIVSKFNHIGNCSSFLDPCCGTGLFLISFSSILTDPSKISGRDIDPIAVKIARVNLIVCYPHIIFEPDIKVTDMLLTSNIALHVNKYDIIATNPPWGADITSVNRDYLKKNYPHITSFESFSYFLYISIQLLKDGGYGSFILPESLLSVKTHSDIRAILSNTVKIDRIICYDKMFSSVFSPVIRLDMQKLSNQKSNELSKGPVEVYRKNKHYTINQERFIGNHNNEFDINIDDFGLSLINKFYSVPHYKLRGTWALGIVTGNNSKFISDKLMDNYEPIYSGADICPYHLRTPTKFISFEPEKMQQVADPALYRADEKLIYRFIFNRPVFAYDNKQSLTLNSANIFIPDRSTNIKFILGLLNSSIYRYIYQLKFPVIKVLRGNLENLPVPIVDNETQAKIISIVDEILNGNFVQSKLVQSNLVHSDFLHFELLHSKLDKIVLDIFDLPPTFNINQVSL